MGTRKNVNSLQTATTQAWKMKTSRRLKENEEMLFQSKCSGGIFPLGGASPKGHLNRFVLLMHDELAALAFLLREEEKQQFW